MDNVPMIEVHEFYKLYANVPIADRKGLVELTYGGVEELDQIYRNVDGIDREIRKLTEERRIYIADSEQYLKEHQA